MVKIWIISFDEVSDGDCSHNAPLAFRDKEKAMEMLKTYKEALKNDYSRELDEGYYFYDEGEYIAEVYGEEYSRDHFTVMLNCVSLN